MKHGDWRRRTEGRRCEGWPAGHLPPLGDGGEANVCLCTRVARDISCSDLIWHLYKCVCVSVCMSESVCSCKPVHQDMMVIKSKLLIIKRGHDSHAVVFYYWHASHTHTHLPLCFMVFALIDCAILSTEMLSTAESGRHITDVNIIRFEDE